MVFLNGRTWVYNLLITWNKPEDSTNSETEMPGLQIKEMVEKNMLESCCKCKCICLIGTRWVSVPEPMYTKVGLPQPIDPCPFYIILPFWLIQVRRTKYRNHHKCDIPANHQSMSQVQLIVCTMQKKQMMCATASW
jgi:hypothetical protein